MTEKEDLRSRLVIGRKRDGRREYDEAALEELVQLCLKPGVSIARTAMDHDVNPNQLRRWITRYQQRQAGGTQRVGEREHEYAVIDAVQMDIPRATKADSVVEVARPAFVPVVAGPVSAGAPVLSSTPAVAMAIALHVRLPNGVQFDIGEARLEELPSIVQMLGGLPCSGSMKT